MIPRRFLVATDGSEPAQAAERFAIDVAGAIGECEVVLVKVVPHHDIVSPRGLIVEPPSDEELAAANGVLTRAEERVRKGLAGTNASLRTLLVEAHTPWQGIVEAALEGDVPSVIVMGNRGKGGISSALLGSVSTHVLHAAHCPVVVVRR